MLTLDPPRWRNGPRICIAANLPAFDTLEAAKAMTRTLEGDSLRESWTCSACGKIHAAYKFRSPAGDSSGNPRPEATQHTYLAAKQKYAVKQIERP